jgi:adenosylcobyric acid synthase
MPAKVLMVQGTSSSVGKSLLTAALCRVFARRGVRVAPFKAQNMSNNAAVCPDGAEIGRAQAVQAVAAGIEPTADMNPVLLKPEGSSRSQVVVLGRLWRTLQAGSYYRRKEELWPIVTAALDRLRSAYELVVMEGAGSPAELNLRSTDMVNMAVARHARAPVLLVGDIDRGGIFAQLLGTLWLLAPEERELVRGLVVNKFRGDATLFADGIRILEERGGLPVLGVIPYLPALAVPEEDAVALEGAVPPAPAAIDIAVIRLPHIANFDDFDPLRAEADVSLRYVQSPAALGRPHAVILPGTKSTSADLAWLRTEGFAEAICALVAQGTSIVGICGGYQMLGRVVRDPAHIEPHSEEAPGLGLLPVETTFEKAKATFQVRARVLGGPGWLGAAAGQEVEGYEIHVGRTNGGRPWLEVNRRNGTAAVLTDGAVSEDGRVWGCYLHGLFASSALRRHWLASLAVRSKEKECPKAGGQSGGDLLHAALDRLADAVEASLDVDRLAAILEESKG